MAGPMPNGSPTSKLKGAVTWEWIGRACIAGMIASCMVYLKSLDAKAEKSLDAASKSVELARVVAAQNQETLNEVKQMRAEINWRVKDADNLHNAFERRLDKMETRTDRMFGESEPVNPRPHR